MRNDSEQFQPLGQKIEKPAAQPAPEWKPTGTPGIERNSQGQLRNVRPTPADPQAPWVYIGTPSTWGRAIEALREEAKRAGVVL